MARKFSRKDFLEALYGEYFAKREGFIMVKTVKRLDPRVSTRYFPNIEILAKEQYHEDQNVFFGVCPHETMKPERGQISYMSALWAGLDFTSSGYSGANLYFSNKSQAAKAIRSFPRPPSIIVESGWGVHLYWLLKDVVPLTSIEAAEKLLGAMNSYFLCQSKVKIDSMMRLPTTFNCRVPGELTSCFVKYINQDFRYTLEDFAGLTLTDEGPTAKSRVAALSGETLDDAPKAVSGGAAIRGVEEPRALQESGLWEPPPSVSPVSPANKPRHAVSGHFVPDARADESTSVQGLQPSAREAGQTDQHAEVLEAVEAEELSEALADEIAEKVVEKLSAKLADKLVDQIVDRLFRLMNGSDKT